MTQKKWDYSTSKDNTVIAASSIAGLGLLAVSASALFTPIALIAAATYTAYSVGTAFLASNEKLRKNAFNKLASKGKSRKLESDHPFAKMISKTSKKLGYDTAPDTYVIDKMLLKSTLPLLLRPWAKKLLEGAAHNIFAASPAGGYLLVSEEALNNDMSDASKEFVVAHEMSHIKADKYSLAPYGKVAIKKAANFLAWGTTLALGLSAFGVALPIATGSLAMAFLGINGARLGAHIVNSYGAHIMEKRADSNAVYLTQDKDAALSCMDKIHPVAMKKAPSVLHLWEAHPNYKTRCANIISTAHKIQRDFSSVAANQNAPVTTPQVSKHAQFKK